MFYPSKNLNFKVLLRGVEYHKNIFDLKKVQKNKLHGV
jgi:hypothetical protein